ncbi:hypothetical protein [Streptomyces sp. NBC_00236]|uniref:hypothetical protein n=1 Tax=unclassified Streptomyces TaxID=2593676 RepID=UPI002E2C845F|nr:hypothetical protein [Streptomyces sp. NBC_00236]
MTDNIISHFEALTTSCNSVQRARAQTETLAAQVADCDAYERLTAQAMTST